MPEIHALERLTQGLAPTGVDLTAWRRSFVLRRLRRGALLSGDVFLDRHVDRLLAEPDSLRHFLDDLSIGVSGFFRGAVAFAQLAESFLPELSRRTSKIRALSLGCAQGQEAWSVAMLLAERFSSFEVIALDRRETFLQQARTGIYTAADLNRVPLGGVGRFFRHTEEGYSVCTALRERVRFEQHDFEDGALPEQVAPGSVDLVLCRNVLIYLSASARDRLFAAISRVLAPGGVLILGEAESDPPRPHFTAHPGATALFRRAA